MPSAMSLLLTVKSPVVVVRVMRSRESRLVLSLIVRLPTLVAESMLSVVTAPLPLIVRLPTLVAESMLIVVTAPLPLIVTSRTSARFGAITSGRLSLFSTVNVPVTVVRLDTFMPSAMSLLLTVKSPLTVTRLARSASVRTGLSVIVSCSIDVAAPREKSVRDVFEPIVSCPIDVAAPSEKLVRDVFESIESCPIDVAAPSEKSMSEALPSTTNAPTTVVRFGTFNDCTDALPVTMKLPPTSMRLGRLTLPPPVMIRSPVTFVIASSSACVSVPSRITSGEGAGVWSISRMRRLPVSAT